MRVLLIAPQPFFTERGTPIAVRQLAEALSADGHRVDLLTYPFGEDVTIPGLTIHRCRRFPGVRGVRIGFSLAKCVMDVMLAFSLYRLAKPGRYDVVHAVEESVYLALLLRWRHRTAVIYDMDSSLAEQLAGTHVVFRLLFPLLSRIERWALRSADQVVPVCQDLARYATAMGAHVGLVVLHDIPLATGGASAGAQALVDNASADACLALYVGNLERYQGIDLLVEAVSLLPEPSPVRVAVVGGPEDTAERFRALAAERGLQHRLHFVGPRPVAQLRHLLLEADILLSPRTHGRNTPLKVYSYMDSGRAILATRLGAHTQVLDDSTALLVEPDAPAFASGLMRLAEDGQLRRRLGMAAKSRVAQSYSPASFRTRVRSIYAQVPGNGATDAAEPPQASAAR